MESKYGTSIITYEDAKNIDDGMNQQYFAKWKILGKYKVYSIDGAFAIKCYGIERNGGYPLMSYIKDGVEYGLNQVNILYETDTLELVIIDVKTYQKEIVSYPIEEVF